MTTTRQTSRAAWRAMVESGALIGKQAQALEAVIEHGPATSGEIIKAAKLGANTNLWRARFTELLARGLIREVGQRKDATTGRAALVWEFTGRTKPLEVTTSEKPITEAQRKRVAAVLASVVVGSMVTGIVDDVIRAARGR